MPEKVAQRLRQQTSSLVERFTDRLSQLRRHPELTSMIRELETNNALQNCRNLLTDEDNLAVGIDGSMDYDERLEMLLFYICATAFECPISVNDELHVELREVRRSRRLSVSAAVPLWLEDISQVSAITSVAETDLDFEISLERIPFAIMTLAELSIALDAIKRNEVRVIFLDRPLSGTLGPASRDLRFLLRMGESALASFTTPYGQLSMLDIAIASVLGPGDLYVPTRGPYIVYAAIKELIKEGEMNKQDLAKRLSLDDNGMEKLVKRLDLLNERYERQLIEKSDIASIKLKDDINNYWKRVSSVVVEVKRRVFESNEHPLQISEDMWLTVLDLSAVNLFLLYELFDWTTKRNAVVIGITKDTNASDFTRSVLPFSIQKGILKLDSPLPSLKNDRAFLTIMAAVHSENVKTPWRTIGYDTCFTTLLENNEKDIPLRAARKLASRERLFVKAYFQLRTFETDPLARSPIFVYDRFYNHKYDEPNSIEIKVKERKKVSQIKPCFEDCRTNPVDNLILYILSRSDNKEVFEAYGHNQLLYLADKAVKAEVKLMRGMLRGIADLQLGALARKEKIFSISRRFRDMRAESESTRERAAGEIKE